MGRPGWRVRRYRSGRSRRFGSRCALFVNERQGFCRCLIRAGRSARRGRKLVCGLSSGARTCNGSSHVRSVKIGRRQYIPFRPCPTGMTRSHSLSRKLDLQAELLHLRQTERRHAQRMHLLHPIPALSMSTRYEFRRQETRLAHQHLCQEQQRFERIDDLRKERMLRKDEEIGRV